MSGIETEVSHVSLAELLENVSQMRHVCVHVGSRYSPRFFYFKHLPQLLDVLVVCIAGVLLQLTVEGWLTWVEGMSH